MVDRTSGLWPYFAEKLLKLKEKAAESGLLVGVHSGYRSYDEQERLYALGRTVKNLDGVDKDHPLGSKVTKARGGESWHGWGVAADVVFLVQGSWSWDAKLPWGRLGQMGLDLGLEWGGIWKFKDLPHFQLTGGLKIVQAQELHHPPAVWEEIARRLATAA